jgi:hypothetical protein
MDLRKFLSFSIAICLAATVARAIPPIPPVTAPNNIPPDKARILANFARLPLQFESMGGQSGSAAQFLSRGRGYSILLSSSSTELDLGEPANCDN